MTATILDGRPLAAELRAELRNRVAAVSQARKSAPSLQIVLVGDDEPSRLYATRLENAGTKVGIAVTNSVLPDTTNEAQLSQALRRLNGDSAVDGVIVAMPLPEHLSMEAVSTVLEPRKDVDGITIGNAGSLYLGRNGHIPSTAAAIMTILHRNDITITGKRAVVLGRSPVVGKPTALLLLQEHATVTICHTRTVGLPEVTREADILIAAAGSPTFVTADMVRAGAVVIDAGINSVDGRIVGDVDFDAVVDVASAITPVPGGVGPLTNVLLLGAVARNAENLFGSDA